MDICNHCKEEVEFETQTDCQYCPSCGWAQSAAGTLVKGRPA